MLEAPLRILLQTAADHARARIRQTAGSGRRQRVVLEDRGQNVGVAVARKRPAAAEHLVEDGPEGEDVRPVVDGLARTCSGDM